MTSRPEPREFAAGDPFPLQGFSHLEWWVGNAYQTAMFLRTMLGFSVVGYRGPETGVAETSSYLLESGDDPVHRHRGPEPGTSLSPTTCDYMGRG